MSNFRPGGFQILPTIVKNLIIINSLIVLAQFALGQMGVDLSDYLGLHHWNSQFFQPWQFLTHMFMHGSYQDLNGTILHLFSNMLALWMFGSVLENLWGPKRFLSFYLICGLGAAVLHMGVVAYGLHQVESDFALYQAQPSLQAYTGFLNEHLQHGGGSRALRQELVEIHRLWSQGMAGMESRSVEALYYFLHGLREPGGSGYLSGIYDQATVGASGAVFGILFAFGFLFPNVLLYIYFLVPIKAKYVVAAYALFELYAGIRNSAGDNIAHFAHLGGMVVAFILLRIWRQRTGGYTY